MIKSSELYDILVRRLKEMDYFLDTHIYTYIYIYIDVKDNIKIDINKLNFGVLTGFGWLRIAPAVCQYEHGV